MSNIVKLLGASGQSGATMEYAEGQLASGSASTTTVGNDTVIKFTTVGASQTFTITKAGWLTAFLVGGGGSGGPATPNYTNWGVATINYRGFAGGGGGGGVIARLVYLEEGTYTVNIGAGALGTAPYNSSGLTGSPTSITTSSGAVINGPGGDTDFLEVKGGGGGCGTWGSTESSFGGANPGGGTSYYTGTDPVGIVDQGAQYASQNGYSGGGSPGVSSKTQVKSWGNNAPDGPYYAIENATNSYYGGAGAGNHGGPGYNQTSKQGGNGGGGNGGSYNGSYYAPTAGSTGTGGGGGGGAPGSTAQGTGGAGGSGCVILRFGEDLLRDDTHKMAYCSGKISLLDQTRQTKFLAPNGSAIDYTTWPAGTDFESTINSWNGANYDTNRLPSIYNGSSTGYVGTHYDEFFLSNGIMTFEFSFKASTSFQPEKPVLSLGTASQHVDIYTDQATCSIDYISGGSSLGTRTSANVGNAYGGRNSQMTPMVIVVDTKTNKTLIMNASSVIADLGSAYGFSFAASGNKLHLCHNQTRSNSASTSVYAPSYLRMIASDVYSTGDTITPLAFPNGTLY